MDSRTLETRGGAGTRVFRAAQLSGTASRGGTLMSLFLPADQEAANAESLHRGQRSACAAKSSQQHLSAEHSSSSTAPALADTRQLEGMDHLQMRRPLMEAEEHAGMLMVQPDCWKKQ